MRSVVLHCHPLLDSYSEALLQSTLSGIRAAGSDPDLYRLAEADGPAAVDLDGVDLLALVHPIWWAGHPAPMLGWVQNTLGPWIDGDEDSETSPLRTVRGILSVSSHGSSLMINRLQGEAARRLVDKTMLGLCADGAKHQWTALYKLDRKEPSELEAFIGTVEVEARDIAVRLTILPSAV